MSRKPHGESTRPRHVTLAVVLQVRDASLQVLLWQRGRAPYRGAWSLPGGALEEGETLEDSIRRHLAAKVDVREVSTSSSSRPTASPAASPPPGARVRVPRPRPARPRPRRAGRHALAPGRRPPADGVRPRRDRARGARAPRGKLSYSNAGFALAPPTFTLAELREVYAAALGHEVSATNLKRVLERRAVIEPTGDRRPSGRAGGRPRRSTASATPDSRSRIRSPRSGRGADCAGRGIRDMSAWNDY